MSQLMIKKCDTCEGSGEVKKGQFDDIYFETCEDCNGEGVIEVEE